MKRAFAFLLSTLCVMSMLAYDFKSGNFYYNITSNVAPYTVEVISGDTKYSGDITIPSSVTYNDITYAVTSIGSYAFRDCSSLTSVTIPNSVTSIGIGAFFGCVLPKDKFINNSVCTSDNNWGATLADKEQNGLLIKDNVVVGAKRDITTATIPNGIVGIGSYAFRDCSSLTSVTIPNSVTSIGSQAFTLCSSLTSVTIPNSVTSIGNSAFSGCSFLTSVTIPNSVTSIKNYTFSGCSSLTSITIPSSVTSIENSAFSGCSSLTSVTIPNSVTSIGSSAFRSCSSLTSVTIPNSVTSIEYGAFMSCSDLTSVTIPNSVTSIENFAFTLCSSLTSITIPNSVTSIGSSTFYDCSSLTSVIIPSSVTSIGSSAFRSCSSLNIIYVGATNPPALGNSTFRGTPSPICYIPCGTKAAYEASDWAQYVSEFVEDCDNGSYSRNVRIGYNTICLPHGSSNFTGATFYEIAHILKNKKKIFFDEVKTLEAGKPYIFYPHSNEVTVYYDNTTSAIPLSHNGLHGTFDGITAASNFLKGKYLVAGDRMVLCGDGCSLAANRAYIELDEIPDKEKPAIPGIKRVSMDYSEENATTALDNITDETIVEPMQEGIYDILGRKVDAPTVSGFYIINGKKVFIAL